MTKCERCGEQIEKGKEAWTNAKPYHTKCWARELNEIRYGSKKRTLKGKRK